MKHFNMIPKRRESWITKHSSLVSKRGEDWVFDYELYENKTFEKSNVYNENNASVIMI